LAVLGQPLPQSVQALDDLLAEKPGKVDGSLVDLDPRDDALMAEDLGERRPVARSLADRLVEENYTADELTGALGGEQEFAVSTAVLLGGSDLHRSERLAMVRELSSAARTPLPRATSARAVADSSSGFIRMLLTWLR
jgi:hypothetical protein